MSAKQIKEAQAKLPCQKLDVIFALTKKNDKIGQALVDILKKKSGVVGPTYDSSDGEISLKYTGEWKGIRDLEVKAVGRNGKLVNPVQIKGCGALTAEAKKAKTGKIGDLRKRLEKYAGVLGVESFSSSGVFSIWVDTRALKLGGLYELGYKMRIVYPMVLEVSATPDKKAEEQGDLATAFRSMENVLKSEKGAEEDTYLILTRSSSTKSALKKEAGKEGYKADVKVKK